MDDLISRSTAKQALVLEFEGPIARAKTQAMCDYTSRLLHRALDAIDIVPAIDPERLRPHGRWVPEEHEDRASPTMTHKYTWYHCSVCGRRLIGYRDPNEAPYCHCGAKMDAKKAPNAT